MNLKYSLICMTLIAVVCDTLLHPFYPQFFEAAFGMKDQQQVGFYFSAICFSVMIAFPFWAWIAKKTNELKILVWTQLAAGLLALYCYQTTSYSAFWIVSLLMILFKGSYLLVYPYILSIEEKEKHIHTIGLLSVVVHFGSIAGALCGGFVVDYIKPANIFLIMAAGDFIQMALSLYLLKTNKNIIRQGNEKSKDLNISTIFNNRFILKLGIITLIFYFSEFIINLFFSRYWEAISAADSKIVSGSVYAIPGLVALIALFVNKRKNQSEKQNNTSGILSSLFLGLAALSLQASQIETLIILSRFFYGWAIFQATVRFDLLLFDLSTPQTYATDYSKIHFFQNLGVLLASFSAGITVERYGLTSPFIIAMAGFAVTIVLHYTVFKTVGIQSAAELPHSI